MVNNLIIFFILWIIIQFIVFNLINKPDIDGDSWEEFNWIICNFVSFPLSAIIFNIFI